MKIRKNQKVQNVHTHKHPDVGMCLITENNKRELKACLALSHTVCRRRQAHVLAWRTRATYAHGILCCPMTSKLVVVVNIKRGSNGVYIYLPS